MSCGSTFKQILVVLMLAVQRAFRNPPLSPAPPVKICLKSIIEPKEHHVFQKFSRTFTWNLKPPAKRTTYFKFSTGLRQIQPTDSCPDKHVYTITSEIVTVGRFCHNGAIKMIEVRNVGKLSLEVSGGQPLDMKDIGVQLGLALKSVAFIDVVLPEKSLIQDFFTPNPFPENALSMWHFKVPHAYYIDVHIMNYTVPTCNQPENIPKMKYIRNSKKELLKPLNVTQPLAETGYIRLSIKNCNMSRSDPPSEGLMVHFQISSIKRKTVATSSKNGEGEEEEEDEEGGSS
ncbi:CUB domain-containing protein 1 [Anabarilius grahami]|uniref:CUB domain-containing protein 1 n=1 Tax=Anabarilius grahami TaxID=495550 RepID=A0A3N0Y304_ANAGA|nr:CUB domain-containing protein 1 [Anabarilius grahami]